MTVEAFTSGDAIVDDRSATAPYGNFEPMPVSMVETVAGVVAGISVIGQARNALQKAGWTATIAANRISVGDTIEAQLIPAKVGAYGLISARWVISSISGANPVWIVGAE